jgi:hypothetical protein
LATDIVGGALQAAELLDESWYGIAQSDVVQVPRHELCPIVHEKLVQRQEQ